RPGGPWSASVYRERECAFRTCRESEPCSSHQRPNEPAPRPSRGRERHSSSAAVQSCQRPLPFVASRCASTETLAEACGERAKLLAAATGSSAARATAIAD